MNRALSIAEIRYLICAAATEHTLVQLAQCSRNFHDPAIRVLWSTIPDLSPLVRCLPQNAWITLHSHIGDSVKLVRPLAPEDWTVFLKYSNLVRQLGISPFSTPLFTGRTPRLEQRVLLELSAYRPVLDLLPNITTFDWTGVRFPEEDLLLVLGFLGPNLSRVHLRVSEEHHSQGTIRTSLSLIANRHTSLKEFQLTLRPAQSRDHLQIMPSIVPFLNNLTALETFRCFYVPLSDAVLSALANLQHLTMLAIRLPETMPWSTLNVQPDQFPSLQRTVICSRPRTYINFGNKVLFSRVKAARILFTDIPTEDELPGVIASMCKQFSPSMLTKLIVNMEDAPQLRRLLSQSSTVLRLEHLQPLFEFRRFNTFEFAMASRYALDAAAYLAIAKAWPNMKSLELALGQCCMHVEPPEMRDVLVPFAMHCPKLTRLGVRFDATKSKLVASGGVAIDHLKGRPSTSLVTSLDCFGSPISGTTYVAAFLALLFPKLKELEYARAPAGTMHAGGLWEEVQQYLPLFATLREDGRLEGRLEEAEIIGV